MWCSRDSKLLMIFFLLIVGVFCQAQYHPQYSQYMFNGLALNPAYAGSQEVLNLALLHRNSQWGNGIEGAPATYTFSGDFPLRNPNLALGVLVFDDIISIFRQTGAYFTYAYRVRTSETGKLSFGLQAGFNSCREDNSRIKLFDPDDPIFSNRLLHVFMPNVGAGVYYYTQNFFAGLSIPQFLTYLPQRADSYSGKLSFSNTMLYSGIIIPMNREFKIKPSTLLQYTEKSFHIDLNCNVMMFREKFDLGASWRSNNTLVGMFQFKVKSLCIGYAYEYALKKPSAINTSHEIMLRYNFKIMVDAVNPIFIR